MDEGFTEYIGTLAESHIFNKDFEDLSKRVYGVYTYLAKSGKEQPQSTHSDRYNFNRSYSISAYYKGYVFLKQLAYINGKENQEKTIKQYFKEAMKKTVKYTNDLSNFDIQKIPLEQQIKQINITHHINL